MGKQRYRKKRRKMWLENPRCRKCGIVTILPDDLPGRITNGIKKMEATPDNMATIQQLRSRFNPNRTIPANGDKRLELWCAKCNFEDAAKEEKRLPLDELHIRSKRH